MKDFTIPRLLALISVLFCFVHVDTMESGEELMNNDSAQMILLNSSQYCFVNDNAIRIIDLNTTTLLSVIDSREDVIMAKAVDNNSVIFIAPLNGSRCMDDNEDGQLSTTLYIIQMIIYSITILVAITNITLHLLVKDLRTISGILVIILCNGVIGSTLMAMGNLTSIYANHISVVCATLFNLLHVLAIVTEATKLSILYQFAYVMYHSYKLKHKQEENIKRSILRYITFIIGSSIVCFLLALAIDIGVNGRIYSDMERYCCIEFHYTFLYVTVVFGEYAMFIILQCITFAVGLTFYFLVSKNCCAVKSINFRVTMVLVATVGIHTVLLIILIITEVPFTILIPAVTSGNLVEQLILLIVFLSSKKVLLVCKTAWLIKDTKSSNNLQLYSVAIDQNTCATES